MTVAKWLVRLGDVDVHVLDDDAFRSACLYNHAAVGRWLISLDPEYAWPPEAVAKLCCWSDARDAWLKGVLKVY